MTRPQASRQEGLIAMVPCQLMKGTVHVRDPSSLSPLHLFTLKAVVKHGELKLLLESFGVGRRVMQSVLADLFYDGLLYLDLRRGKAVPAPSVLDALDSGELEGLLARRAPREVEITWIQEMVSGGLMVYPSVSKYLRFPNYNGSAFNLAPRPGRSASLKDLSVRTLAKAAVRILEEGVPTGGSVIERVERITDRRLVGSRTFYVPIRMLTPRPDQEPILLPEVDRVPPAVVDAWTAVLNPTREPLELLEKMRLPRDPFKEISPAGMSEEWEMLLGRIRGLIDAKRPGSIDLGDLSGLLVDLNDLARRITGGRLAAATLRGIGGPGARHFAALQEVLAGAKSLIVIGSAFLRPARVREVAELLVPALERGAKAVLLWGLGDAGTRSEDRRVLDEAKAAIADVVDTFEFEEGSLWVLSSVTPFHSKFVAVDGGAAIISSLNWLSSHPQGQKWEASIVVTGGNLPMELLSYGLERIPSDHPLWSVSEETLPTPRWDQAPESATENPWTTATENLAAAFAILDGDTEGPGWSAFRMALDEASKLAPAIRDAITAFLVKDAEHRRIFISALANARGEIVVTSDRLREEGAGRVFEKLSAEALARGVKLTVGWGREVAEDVLEDDAQKSMQRARTLQMNLGEALEINTKPGGIHGKVVLVDSSFVLVSSFNFLSFGGVKGGERTLSGELGLAVFDPDVTESIKKSLARQRQYHRKDRSIRTSRNG